MEQQKVVVRSTEFLFMGLVSSFIYVTVQLITALQLTYITAQFGVGFLLGLDLLILAGICGFAVFGGKLFELIS